MDWYTARILYERLVDEDEEKASRTPVLFEEKMFVFSCGDGDDFDEKLAAIAKKNEEEFENGEGNTVTYVFREILEVQDTVLEPHGDGTEVFYRYWHSPSERDFEEMRKTETEAWWKAEEDQEEKP